MSIGKPILVVHTTFFPVATSPDEEPDDPERAGARRSFAVEDILTPIRHVDPINNEPRAPAQNDTPIAVATLAFPEEHDYYVIPDQEAKK